MTRRTYVHYELIGIKDVPRGFGALSACQLFGFNSVISTKITAFNTDKRISCDGAASNSLSNSTEFG
jgi:hypothetical protein